ncbi:MAG TPA: pilus assembly PilX N-terminal domain-containing protein [Patescibacteria group bacterium]|nr:pilus assembly PilX N-terminal domain-containing protein [Patescibacteria group bacterium]
MKSGQAALTVLLVIAVALGFGLSIISQATTDVRIARQEQESARAFNAAEAGIEAALQKLSIVAGAGSQEIGGLSDDVSGTYEVNPANEIQATYQENDTVQVNLANHDPGLTSVTINWVKADSNIENPGCSSEAVTPASLVLTIIKGTAYGYSQRNLAYNACGVFDNGMAAAALSGDAGYLKKVEVDIEAGDELMRIRPVYNQTSLLVTGNAPLPIQGYEIASSAQVGTNDQSLATKAIEVTRTEPGAPAVFDYVLFSGTNLTK